MGIISANSVVNAGTDHVDEKHILSPLASLSIGNYPIVIIPLPCELSFMNNHSLTGETMMEALGVRSSSLNDFK